uniref:Arginyl-tRNA synthetase, class Ic n=1 Tax=Tanacetum cinerariifolium TaxID=118510 RepID=A0A6L2JDV2_TANCI|nr:arginyl-tRNA synthetase, class Ic [Tanacetum cinerariifolium]
MGQGIQYLETAVLELVDLQNIFAGGLKWAVNQMSIPYWSSQPIWSSGSTWFGNKDKKEEDKDKKKDEDEKPDIAILKASTPTNIRQLVIENESRIILDSSSLRPLENIVPREHSRQEIAKPIIFPTLTRTPSTSTTSTLTTQIPKEFVRVDTCRIN